MQEVIAAESGMIIGKDDGNEDNHCSCSGNWNAVYIEHSDGSIAWYGHLKSDLLTSKQIGQMVTKGEYLGIVASSGCSTAPHLHFEVYDDTNNLIDPFSGPCNDLNSESWWSSQPAYHESQINAILTHDAPPVLGCPTNEEFPNFSNEFMPGETMTMAVYYRDLLVGNVTDLRIIRPDGSVWNNWNFISNNNHITSYYYWNRTLPQNASSGTWAFEADYNDITYSHNFQVLSGVIDNDNDGFDESVDCDDNNPNINPNATEVCDDLDNNCNGNIDEGLEMTFYADLDNDDFGNPNSPMIDCSQPANASTNNEDCDDNNPNINPNATEIANNGIDEDCDGNDLITSSIYQMDGATIEIFPNPTSKWINIKVSKKINYMIRIYDTNGKFIWSSPNPITTSDFQIDISNFIMGTYLIKISDEKIANIIVEKIVIVK